jgi:predicted ATP-binding protein involved in virulence
VSKLKLGYVFAQKVETRQILGNAEFFIREYVLAHERESTHSDPKTRTKEAVDKFNAHFCDAQLLTKLVDLSKADFNTPVFSNATGDLVSINELSDGEKQLYARVIALMMLEPRNSIILIDEPEIALHPAWQQKIMQIYAAIGENNQFIVVTHSPQVIRSVPYQNRIILHKNNDERKIEAIYMDSPPTGIDINSILSEIMGAEKIPADLANLYREYRHYVENKQEQTPEAQAIKRQMLAQESEQSEFMQEMGFLIDLRAMA